MLCEGEGGGQAAASTTLEYKVSQQFRNQGDTWDRGIYLLTLDFHRPDCGLRSFCYLSHLGCGTCHLPRCILSNMSFNTR